MCLFQIGEREFGWDEVVAAAKVWGEWTPFVTSVRESLACWRFAVETDRLPNASTIREAAIAFRYAHNLISAEETEAWLKRWGLTVETWMSCVRRELLRKLWDGQLKKIVSLISISDVEVNEVVRDHAICSGRYLNWARKLAGHSALVADCLDFRTPSSIEELILRIETEFQRTRKDAINSKLIDTKINDHRLDWIHFECDCLWLTEERVAREAAWCITEDGLTLDQVAAQANQPVKPWHFYADEIETNIRPYFLAARQGDFLGPWKIREAYPLFSVMNKRMPDARDPRIFSRAEQEIVNSLLAQSINERVKWLM